MSESRPFFQGEYHCQLDDRHRLAIPQALGKPLVEAGGPFVLVKERLGCASLWNAEAWQATVNLKVDLARQKVQGGLWNHRIEQAQMFGRLLSTLHAEVTIDKKYRLVVPEDFRAFLRLKETVAAAPGQPAPQPRQVAVVGAAVCVELWHPKAWLKYLARRMPKFRQLVEELS